MAAAGSGTRLGAGMPKALVELRGRTLVSRAIEALAAGGVDRAVVIIPDGLFEQFAAALSDAPIPVDLVVGGAERQQSVQRGLDRVGEGCILLVHDAARPLVPAAVVRSVIDSVHAGSVAVTPMVPVTDSIRMISGEDSRVVDRSNLRAVQTPQGFSVEVLRAAHVDALRLAREATDDAGLCELAGHRVTLVEGSRLAFKITDQFDLRIAEALVDDED